MTANQLHKPPKTFTNIKLIMTSHRTRSEEFHRQAARRREVLSRRASVMRKKHRRSVEKSSVYFDERERVELILQVKNVITVITSLFSFN